MTTVRRMRLQLRHIGRDDGELSDTDVRHLMAEIAKLCHDGQVARRALGQDRVQSTWETRTGGLKG